MGVLVSGIDLNIQIRPQLFLSPCPLAFLSVFDHLLSSEGRPSQMKVADSPQVTPFQSKRAQAITTLFKLGAGRKACQGRKLRLFSFY